jgi:hypothetical protein
MIRPAALFLVLALTTGCSPAPLSSPGPFPIPSTSADVQVKGEYSSLALDRVDRVSIENGKIVVHGSAGSVALEPPAGADTSKPTRTWALTTETEAGRKRLVTFTHAMSIQDFTIELPEGDDELRYGVFSNPEGADVMVFAWGSNSKSYWGYLTIQGAQSSQSPRSSQSSRESAHTQGQP